MGNTFEISVGMENFTFREMHVGEKIEEKIVAFLSPVVYYLGDLLKSAAMALYGTKYSLVYNLIFFLIIAHFKRF